LMTSSLREETTGRPLAFDASQSLGPGVGATEPCARDLLLLPIRSPGELEGALLILRRAKAGPLSDEELLFLKEIASRLGTALAGAHAFAVAERERTRAEQAHAANDRFVAAISRELRAPLVSQLGWLDLLKGGGLDPQRTAQVIEVMESDAKLQLQLIDDLLDLSRSVIGKLEVTFQPVDLLDTLWLAADALREAAQAARVELVLPPRDGGAAWMVGDPTRLQQVITHLLSNAIRFSLPDSRVEVSLQAGEEQLVLAVRDHGVGIEADHLEAFFEPFWKETAGGRGGVGLGLPLVHSLVEGHHGSVRAHSEGPGKGTTVEVTLPRDLRHPVRDADRPAPDRSH